MQVVIAVDLTTIETQRIRVGNGSLILIQVNWSIALKEDWPGIACKLNADGVN